MVFEVAVPEVTLAVFDVLTPLAVPFAVPAEPDMVVEWEVEGLEAVVIGVVVADFGAVGVPDVSWIGPPVRVVLLALSSSIMCQCASPNRSRLLDEKLVIRQGMAWRQSRHTSRHYDGRSVRGRGGSSYCHH